MGFLLMRKWLLLKRISLGRIGFDDVLIWPHSHDGSYSCKSGYRFLREEADLSYSPMHTDRPQTE